MARLGSVLRAASCFVEILAPRASARAAFAGMAAPALALGARISTKRDASAFGFLLSDSARVSSSVFAARLTASAATLSHSGIHPVESACWAVSAASAVLRIQPNKQIQ